MNNTNTLRRYLKLQASNYHNIASEFDNYSPKNALYTGYAKMCEKMLHDLSDETLEQSFAFKKFNYCGECGRYNNFRHSCQDDFGNEIKCLVFKDTEACDCFKQST